MLNLVRAIGAERNKKIWEVKCSVECKLLIALQAVDARLINQLFQMLSEAKWFGTMNTVIGP